MKVALSDRIISVLAYYTFGIFSIIWIIFANLTKKRITQYLSFNLYQAIFVSILLYVLSLLYGIAVKFISIIPFIGKFVVAFHIFFNETPLYLTFTLSGLLVTILITYLSILCLMGKRAYLPVVSDIVKTNFGG